MSEHDRLTALISTRLLDTDPEERFDRITRLAASALRVDVALITLLDEERQWFKSAFGVVETETPRAIAFCDYAIREAAVMVVPDMTKDKRFKDNPLVTGPHNVRFYAGAPLITKDGHALGTLCVIDTKPRDNFSDKDSQMLSDLAATVMTEIENSHQSQIIDDLALVNDELRHRMGNMYAHVSALVSMMGRNENDKDRLVRRLREKIQMLSATQALLASHKWTSVPMSALIETTLAPFISRSNRDRVKLQTSPDVSVSPRGAFILSLMLNELGTNAVKHGALSTDAGELTFGWESKGDDITFTWEEILDVPKTVGNPNAGFGSQILKKIVPMDLQGVADHSLFETGLIYKVSGKSQRILHSFKPQA